MARNRSSTTHRFDNDGVRIAREPGIRPAIWLVAFVVMLLIAGMLLRHRSDDSPAQIAASKASRSTAREESTTEPETSSQQVPAAPRRLAAVRPPDAAAANQGGETTQAPMKQSLPNQAKTADAPAIQSADDGDGQAGIAVFPPPGTKPIKRGIVVPDNFELPPGYVRHYQATDDGKQLAPILMFHPDYKPVDERGDPIPLPEDRVVPAEMAPPGLEVRMLDVPNVQVPMIEAQPAGDGGVNPE